MHLEKEAIAVADQAATEIVCGDHAKSSAVASRTKLPSPTKAREARGILGGPPAGTASSGGFGRLSDCRKASD
jgi:hypothetical protein